jgi:cellulose synthase/poly-beta-1,6-N-acetylglucosamine synthase-like glycosyltransferase
MKCSLIISIYKSPEFLDLVLCSVQRQTLVPDEIIISEDGEFLPNASIIKKWKSRWPGNSKLIHLTQKDIGNRKPLAMNKAAHTATSPYLIFIDGDCILRKDFIETHLCFSDIECFLTGRRVEFSKNANTKISEDYIQGGKLEKIPVALMVDALLGHTFHIFRFFKTPTFLRKIFRRDFVKDIRGCNFSLHRVNLEKINGFNNNFSGAYEEDTETQWRLIFLGLKMKSVRNAAIQYHLWHQEQIKDVENIKRLKELLEKKGYRASNGLNEAPSIE